MSKPLTQSGGGGSGGSKVAARRALRAALAGAASAGLLSVALFAIPALAASVAPTVIPGDPGCGGGLRVEPVVSGTYDGVTIVVHGSIVDFTTAADGEVTRVIVKGGPDANVYSYGAPITSDTGLHAPINPSNSQPYALQSLCFFGDVGATPTTDSLIEAVKALELPHGIENALFKKLEGAKRKLAEGESEEACEKLQSFSHHVSAQRGKRIDEDDADALIVDGAAVRGELGC